MKKITSFAFAVFISLTSLSQDTFSIIAVDPETGEVGSAGASCVTGIGAQGIIDIITDIIPGRGGVNSQAYVCIPNTNLESAIDLMDGGSSPSEIIDWLFNNDSCASQNFNPEFRQYGIADFDDNGDPRTAGFSGSSTDAYTEDRQGPTYSIQGNILLDQTVINNMEENFTITEGSLADKLMAALQGANFAGADSRCLAAGTSSTTAYITVYRETDAPGNPYLRLNVGEQAPGVEPIDILQGLYDEFLSLPDNEALTQLQLYPNPTYNSFSILPNSSIVVKGVTVYNVLGKQVYKDNKSGASINASSWGAGIYFVSITSDTGTIIRKLIKK